jgi:hypothetical protein
MYIKMSTVNLLWVGRFGSLGCWRLFLASGAGLASERLRQIV